MMKNQTQLDPISRIEKVLSLKKGATGRFISVKIGQLAPEKEVETVTFYSKPIRKYRIAEKTYFIVKDILTLASPTDVSIDTIKYTDNFDEIKNKVIKIVDQQEVSDAEGILKLIKEVIGIFPGPLARWLTT